MTKTATAAGATAPTACAPNGTRKKFRKTWPSPRRALRETGSCPRDGVTDGPSAAELLKTPGALLTRSHLRELGLGRSAIDAVFRRLPVIVFPGSSRPHIRRDDYIELVEQSIYDDNRVR
jgi:hypothetical protein